MTCPLSRLDHQITIILMALFMAGCKFELSPPIAGTVESHTLGVQVRPVDLTHDQLRALNEWFVQHRTGWSSSPASYVPAVIVRVRHADSTVSVINVLSTMVVVNSHDGQYAQQLPPDELAALRRIIGLQP